MRMRRLRTWRREYPFPAFSFSPSQSLSSLSALLVQTAMAGEAGAAAVELKERFRGCLLGLAVGDAVGTTVDGKKRGSFTPLTDMVGGGRYRLLPGQVGGSPSVFSAFLFDSGKSTVFPYHPNAYFLLHYIHVPPVSGLMILAWL